jgi:hypothetical protein
MLSTLPADIQEALDLGMHVLAGEAEGHMADILRDIAAGTAEPVYNMPEMVGAIAPISPPCARRPSYLTHARIRLRDE